MREAILNTYVACTCAACGKTYKRQAYRVCWESVTAQEAYQRELKTGFCPECREKQAEDARAMMRSLKESSPRLKPKKRRTAADIIQEYNLKHLHDKKRRKK